MQSRKKIERFIANVEVGTDSTRDREVLDEVVQKHIDFKQGRPQCGSPRKWKIAMRCRSAKVAALLAAAIVLASTFGMGGGSVAFSQIRHGVNSTLAWLRQMVVGRTPGEAAVDPPVFRPTGEQTPRRTVTYAARLFRVRDNEADIWQSLRDRGIELVAVSTDPEVYFTTLTRAQAESFDEVVALRTLAAPRVTVSAGGLATIALTQADPQNGRRGFALGLLPLVSSGGREVQSTISFHDGDSGFEIPDAGTEPGGGVLIRVKGIRLSEEAQSEGPLEFLIRIQVDLP